MQNSSIGGLSVLLVPENHAFLYDKAYGNFISTRHSKGNSFKQTALFAQSCIQIITVIIASALARDL
jgi:hypothetical protein